MNVLTETFPTACLMFGLFCALLAGIANHRKMRDLKRRAALRRVLSPDTRPLVYMDSSLPWKHEQWWKV